MSTKNSRLVDLKISDIIIGERIRQYFDEEYIAHLAKNIDEDGLDDPVSVVYENGKYTLMDGECRIRAFELLGRDTIPALVKDKEIVINPGKVEINRNNMKKPFSPIEKYHTYQKLYEEHKEAIKARKGRPKKSQVIDSVENKNSGIFHSFSPEPGEKTQDYLSREAGYNSVDECRAVIRVMTSGCIDEVTDAMNREVISTHRAAVIASAPKNKQLTLLAEARRDPDTLTTQLNKDAKSRRTANRKKKAKIPKKRLKHMQYNVIRVAPDWNAELLSDILETPVNDYAADDIALVAVECNAKTIPDAIGCLAQWDFEYVTTVTVYNPKRRAEYLELTVSETAHIVFGIRRGSSDVGEVVRFRSLVKTSPVHTSTAAVLGDVLVPIIEGMFPDAKTDRRIDMSSTGPRKNWIVWKVAYADDETAAETIRLQEVDGKGAPAGGDIVDEADAGDEEEIFEPKRELRIF
jgi:ParB/RepB/Spo0J family partition protein